MHGSVIIEYTLCMEKAIYSVPATNEVIGLGKYLCTPSLEEPKPIETGICGLDEPMI